MKWPIAVGLLWSMVCFSAFAAELPRVPGLEYQWVARDMQANGAPMQIQAFAGPIPAKAVSQFYRARWRAQGLRVRSQRHSGWRVLSTRINQRFVSVSVRSTGNTGSAGSEGFLVSSLPAKPRAAMGLSIPLPSGTRVLAQQNYRDGGRDSESITLASFTQPATLALHFHELLEARGWRLQSASRTQTTVNGYRAEYTHSAGALQLFIHRDTERYHDQSLALVHLTQGASVAE